MKFVLSTIVFIGVVFAQCLCSEPTSPVNETYTAGYVDRQESPTDEVSYFCLYVNQLTHNLHYCYHKSYVNDNTKKTF